jgi:hypothetical protein
MGVILLFFDPIGNGVTLACFRPHASTINKKMMNSPSVQEFTWINGTFGGPGDKSFMLVLTGEGRRMPGRYIRHQVARSIG